MKGRLLFCKKEAKNFFDLVLCWFGVDGLGSTDGRRVFIGQIWRFSIACSIVGVIRSLVTGCGDQPCVAPGSGTTAIRL
jgi:hypothetical protein